MLQRALLPPHLAHTKYRLLLQLKVTHQKSMSTVILPVWQRCQDPRPWGRRAAESLRTRAQSSRGENADAHALKAKRVPSFKPEAFTLAFLSCENE